MMPRDNENDSNSASAIDYIDPSTRKILRTIEQRMGGLGRYFSKKLTFLSFGVNFTDRLNDPYKSSFTDQSQGVRATCAAFAAAGDASVSAMLYTSVAAGTSVLSGGAASFVTVPASLIATTPPITNFARLTGNGMQRFCHMMGPGPTGQRVDLSQQRLSSSQFVHPLLQGLPREKIITLNDIMLRSSQAKEEPALEKLFNDPEKIKTAKRHIKNIRQLQEPISEEKKLSFSKKCEEAAQHLAPLGETSQLLFQLSQLTGDRATQHLAIGLGSVHQISQLTPKIFSALSNGTPFSAVFPALNAFIAIASLVKLFSKKKKGPDPHQQMTETILRNMFEMCKGLHDSLHQHLDQIQQGQQLIYRGVLDLSNMILRLENRIQDIRIENRIAHQQIQTQIERSHELILATLQDEMRQPLEILLNNLKHWNKHADVMNATRRDEVIHSINHLLPYIRGDENMLSARKSQTGTLIAEKDRGRAEKDTAVLAKIDVENANGLENRLGYLHHVARQTIREMMNEKENPRYQAILKEILSSTTEIAEISLTQIIINYLINPFEFISTQATFNPFVWTELTQLYFESRSLFNVEDPHFIELNAIVAAGNRQQEFIHSIQTTPILFSEFLKQYKNILLKIISMPHEAIEKQNENLNKPFQELKNHGTISLINIREKSEHLIKAFSRAFPNDVIKGTTYSYKEHGFNYNPFIPVPEIQSKTITPGDLKWKDHIFHIEDLAIFVAAENLKIGKIKISYHGVQHTINPDNSSYDRNFSVFFQFENEQPILIANMNQAIRNGGVTAKGQTFTRVNAFDHCHHKAMQKIIEFIFRQLQSSIAAILENQLANGLNELIDQLNSVRIFLIAFAHVAGNTELLTLLSDLPSGQKIYNDLKQYTEIKKADLNIPLPHTEFLRTAEEAIKKISTHLQQPNHFNSLFEICIETIKEKAQLLKEAELFLQEENEKKIEKEIEKQLNKIDKLFLQWKPWRTRWLDQFPEDAKKEEEYKTCRDDINIVHHLLGFLHEELSSEEKSSFKMLIMLELVNELCKEIHHELQGLNNYKSEQQPFYSLQFSNNFFSKKRLVELEADLAQTVYPSHSLSLP